MKNDRDDLAAQRKEWPRKRLMTELIDTLAAMECYEQDRVGWIANRNELTALIKTMNGDEEKLKAEIAELEQMRDHFAHRSRAIAEQAKKALKAQNAAVRQKDRATAAAIELEDMAHDHSFDQAGPVAMTANYDAGEWTMKRASAHNER